MSFFGMERVLKRRPYSLFVSWSKTQRPHGLSFLLIILPTVDEKEEILGRSQILGVSILVVDHLYHWPAQEIQAAPSHPHLQAGNHCGWVGDFFTRLCFSPCMLLSLNVSLWLPTRNSQNWPPTSEASGSRRPKKHPYPDPQHYPRQSHGS
jgi:hypothetical protein